MLYSKVLVSPQFSFLITFNSVYHTGSLAGNAIYGALKPDSEQKTVIIHENAPAPAAAAPAAPAPAAPVPVAPVPVAPMPVAPGTSH